MILILISRFIYQDTKFWTLFLTKLFSLLKVKPNLSDNFASYQLRSVLIISWVLSHFGLLFIHLRFCRPDVDDMMNSTPHQLHTLGTDSCTMSSVGPSFIVTSIHDVHMPHSVTETSNLDGGDTSPAFYHSDTARDSDTHTSTLYNTFGHSISIEGKSQHLPKNTTDV